MNKKQREPKGFKKGDKLKMVNCIEARNYSDKIWVAKNDEQPYANYYIIFLEEFSGFFDTNCLEKIKD